MEFRLREELPNNVLEQVRRRFRQFKYREEELRHVLLQYENGVAGVARSDPAGFKLTAADGSEVIQFGPMNLGLSYLAPYPGWEKFRDRAWQLYEMWRRDIGDRRALGRIGVRYINRLDIPDDPQSPTYPIGRYLNFRSVEPAFLDEPIRLYEVTVHTGITADSLGVNLTSASVPSPIIGHSSLTLDIDIFRQPSNVSGKLVDVPQTEHDIKALLDLIRLRRTEIFEACITDSTRALIS